MIKKFGIFKICSLFLIIFMLLYPLPVFGLTGQVEGQEKTVIFSIDKQSYSIGGNEVITDVAPYIKDGRTMVPVAFVAPALGTESAQWLPEDRTVIITKGEKKVSIKIGSKEILVNGQKMMMDVAAEIQDIGNGGGRTMLPVAFIARALEVGYQWNAAARSVSFYGYSKTYAQKGTFGPAVGIETIEGSVIVKADGISLQNMIIKGNLTIAEEVGDGDVALNNITVNGATYIRGGGKDSIHINGGQYQSIIIENTNGIVRVVAIDVNNLSVVISEDAKGEEIILEGNFAIVTVEAKETTVTTQGQTTIQEIIVAETATLTKLNINSGTVVEKMVLNSNTEVKGTGTIKTAEVNAEGVTFEKLPEDKIVADKGKISPIVYDDGFVPINAIIVTTDDQTLAVGATLQLTTTISPTNVTNKEVKWSSDESSVATVSATGLVMGVTPGIAVITVTTVDGGKTDNVVIKVLPMMGGTVNITGTLKYAEVLTANVANIAYTPITNADQPTYQWEINGVAIEGATAETYTITVADIGQTITVSVTADGVNALGSQTSDPTEVIVKADVGSPATPVLAGKTATSVTLVANAAHEYSIDAGANWQTSNEFTGLNSLTEYTFSSRVKETITHNSSAVSEGTVVTTDPPVMSGTAAITGVAKYGEVLTANITLTYTTTTEADIPTYQWKRDGANIGGATSLTYTLVQADIGQTITVTVTADGSHATGSVASEPTGVIAKADVAAPPAPSLASKTATSITLVANSLQQFSMDSGVNWQDSEVFTGLTLGTEYTLIARVKETPTHNQSAISVGSVIATDAPVMGGTITITGTLNYAEVLTANISNITYTPTTNADQPIYQWKRGGVNIEGSTSATYTLVQADIGQAITVIVIADGIHAMGSVISSATEAIAKADVLLPSAPVLASKTITSITLLANVAYEYTIDNGANWQTSNVFTGLTALTEYTFKCRIKETDTHNVSTASEGTGITTNPPVMTGTVIITGIPKYGEILTANTALIYTPATLADVPTYQWKRGGVNIFGAISSTYLVEDAADVGQIITVTVAADGTHATGNVTSSATGTIDKADSPAAPAAPVLSSKTATSITLVVNVAYEYTINNGANWQASNEFTELNTLTEYTFKGRLKATATHYASEVSEGTSITTSPPLISGTVTIEGTPKYGQVLTANPVVTYTPATLADLPTYQWKRGGANITGSTSSTYALAEADVGQLITVTVSADGVNATGSVTSEPTGAIDKADGPTVPDSPVIIDNTTGNSVTLEDNATLQYSIDNETNWQASNVFTGLNESTEYTFIARVKETTTHKASAASGGTTITTPLAKPNFVSATTNTDGSQIIVTFDKNMTTDPSGEVASFIVQVGGATNIITAVANAGANETIELTLTTPIHYGTEVTIAYSAGNLIAVDSMELASFTAQTVTNAREYSIGDVGPGGGIIFYTLGTGTWKYLEAAPTDQTSSFEGHVWGRNLIIGTSAELGTGKANTAAIIALHTSIYNSAAAKLCINYRGGGFDDWFLPSDQELYYLFNNIASTPGLRAAFGFTENVYYWTSTDSAGDAYYAFGRVSNNSITGATREKTNWNRVRAVRSF